MKDRLKQDLTRRIEWNTRQVQILKEWAQKDGVLNAHREEMDTRRARYEQAITDYKNQLKKL